MPRLRFFIDRADYDAYDKKEGTEIRPELIFIGKF
jgi:hypothetical protein